MPTPPVFHAGDVIPSFTAAIPEPYLLTTAVLRGDERQDAALHQHPEGMLIWVAHGSMRAFVGDGFRALTVGDGLWLPPFTPHAVQRDRGSVSCFTYFAADASPEWDEVGGVALSAAFRELLLHLSETAMPEQHRVRAQQVVRELLPERATATGAVATPSDARIQPLVKGVLSDPADDRSVDDWARQLALSTRTLSRIFAHDIGMSFSQWRTAVRMSAAMRMLAQCVPVSVVAHRVGYTTTSAFSAAFRRATGGPPSQLQSSSRRVA